MIHFDLPKEQSSILKVIGIGGGGSNAVNHMYSQNIEGVNFIICNTDAQAIAQSNVPNKVQLGPHLTQGLGAGANPEIGRQATEESLEEIKRMLEVNTKMAFVTAGMGGGTGTGGAPIISKICKDLGILTVGIVTTPFSYEGKKRQQQAEEGIKILKQYVDTLLVISNDKLRHQFGNLKMREAFAKADNVLATAAKCITDVINSTGQINVDFADVCTVMKNGGVAILGNATCEGEDRAQRAIEEALNSPLLNDNEIKGAKWILININSAEGDNEFTMDEVEIIQNYLLSQAGEDTDVILGLGYDNTLGSQIGITLIATGFEHQDPFIKKEKPKAQQPKEDKIVMTLGGSGQVAQKPEVKAEDVLAPKLIDEAGIGEIPMPGLQDAFADLRFELELPPVAAATPPAPKEEPAPSLHLQMRLKDEVPEADSEEQEFEKKKQKLEGRFEELRQSILASAEGSKKDTGNTAGSYPSRPANIYAEMKPVQPAPKDEEEESLNMQLVIKGETGTAVPPVAANEAPPAAGQTQQSRDPEMDEQKRRASERLQKLRNLSFNLNAADPHNEFEHVPAYIRRNMDLQNNSNHVESFYSSYTVKDDGAGGNISTINTFLDGKKPD